MSTAYKYSFSYTFVYYLFDRSFDKIEIGQSPSEDCHHLSARSCCAAGTCAAEVMALPEKKTASYWERFFHPQSGHRSDHDQLFFDRMHDRLGAAFHAKLAIDVGDV